MRGDRIGDVQRNEARDQCELAQHPAHASFTVGCIEEKCSLPLARDGGIAETQRLEDGKLELVVDHMVVLPHAAMVSQRAGGSSNKRVGGTTITGAPGAPI